MAARQESTSRGLLVALAAVCTVAIVYGSLLPLEYKPLEFEAALERFRQIPFLALGIGRRADWVANGLLFLPFGFLWATAALTQASGVAARIGVAVAVTAVGMVLAVAVEFVQAYFPIRTMSQNDIVAEWIGTAVGAALAAAIGPWLWNLACRAFTTPPPKNLWLLGGLYAAGLALYSIMPLDLVLSLDELLEKVQEGKIGVLPAAGDLASHVASFAAFVPIGILGGLRRERSTSAASGASAASGFGWGLAWGIAAAFTVEVLQALIYSRSAFLSQAIAAAAGCGVGSLAARSIDMPRLVAGDVVTSRASPQPIARVPWTLLACICIPVVAILVSWPLTWPTPGLPLEDALRAYLRPPFAAMYYGSEFQALTVALRDMATFLPLGFVLHRTAETGDGRLPVRSIRTWLCLGIGVLLCIGLEFADAYRPGRVCDVTGSLLYLCGLLAGSILAARTARHRWSFNATRRATVGAAHRPPAAPTRKIWRISRRTTAAIVGVALVAVTGAAVRMNLWSTESSIATGPVRYDVSVGTRYTDRPLIPFEVPRVERVPLPDFPGAHAVWGASGVDRDGNIWIGISANGSGGVSARLVALDPSSGRVTLHGDAVSMLRQAGLARPGDRQMKIHTKIYEAADGYLYFASMDEEGEKDDGSRLPTWGSHLWRYHPAVGHWEHLAAVPEGLIAVALGGQYVYALGLFGHVVYQYDIQTQTLRRQEIGSIGGHISRNLLADVNGHVYVPRLRQAISAGAATRLGLTTEQRLRATLVELDETLQEVAETPLVHYANDSFWSDHGIVSFVPLRDDSIVFATSRGYLYRVFPSPNGPAAVVELGWLHPDGPSYSPALFSYDGQSEVAGLAKRKDHWEWVYLGLNARQGVASPLPTQVVPANALLYGSATRDNTGAFIVVGQVEYRPALFRLIPQLTP